MYRLYGLTKSFIRAGNSGALRWHSAFVLSLAAGLLMFGALSPECGTCFLRYHTGRPCPLCGGTRSLSALFHLDIACAVKLHLPLVVLVVWLAASGLRGLFSQNVENSQLSRACVFLNIWGWFFLGWYAIMCGISLFTAG